MKPSDVARMVEAAVKARRPSYIWGEPGLGKSSVVKQVAKKLGMGLIDLRAVLLDPVDLRGLPVIVNKGGDGASLVDWAPPKFLPLKGRKTKVFGIEFDRGIIFADELAQAAPLVQAAFLQGILDHRVGEAELDPNWVWVAASNRQQDRAGTHRLITPLLNRFSPHIDMEVSREDWQAWAIGNGICPEVRSFLNYKDMLMDFDPSKNERAFPTPRSWEFVSDLLPHTPNDLLHHSVAGTVGEGAAVEFMTYIKIYRDLPDADVVLKQPESYPIPRDSSVLYALCGSLVERIKADPVNPNKVSRDLLGRFMKVVDRMPQEFGMLAFRDGSQANRGLLIAPGASPWMQQQKSYTIGQPA